MTNTNLKNSSVIFCETNLHFNSFIEYSNLFYRIRGIPNTNYF